MKRIVLCLLVLMVFVWNAGAQNVFDPSDPIIRYDAQQPLGSPQHPNPAIPGMQKWVSTPVVGVSLGSSTFDASSFKQYFINYHGQGMAFRLKFPKSYNNPDSAHKKYPVMLFLHGGGEVGCPSNGGIYNNERPLWIGGNFFANKANTGWYDGFLLFPQFVVTDPSCFAGWLSAPSTDFDDITAILDTLAKYVRADIDRVVADGLSGGGYGCFRMAALKPQYLAKIMPTSTWGPTDQRDKFVHIPIWFATGGLDAEPSPAQAQTCLKAMQDVGADIRYTLFPTLGHNCWYQHWEMSDFMSEMLAAHKANPLVFFQHNEFCDPNTINAKLGLTPGFYAYEWQKDGQLIASAEGTTNIIVNNNPVISYTGNEITVKAFGTYRARFKRTATSDWSDWSPRPAEIKAKSTTQTAPIQVDGLHSKVLSALDGSTTAPLTLPDGFLNYQWVRVSDGQLMNSTQKFNAPVGVYKALYSEQFGCSTNFSPDFTVVDANGSPKPASATNLTAVPLSQTVLQLDWAQAAGPTDAESGFEVYRSTTSGGPYQFVALLPASVKSFRDSNLITNTSYYYEVRAVNGTGASVASNEAAVKTVTDRTPPTAPSNLTATVQSITSVLLQWNTSTDSVGVARYDIYMNGEKLYSTPLLQFTVTQLNGNDFYTFVIKAVDSAGNASAPSNQVSVNTSGKLPAYTPGVPPSLTATDLSYSIIALSWSDTCSNETGYEIVRSATSGGTYIPVGTVKANDTTFTDSGLVAASTYFYKIRTVAATDESPFSNSVSATTSPLPPTPVPPTDLTGVIAPNGNVALSWSDNSANETGFNVYRSSDDTTFTLLSTLPPNSNGYTDTTATGVAVYYYYVDGANGAGHSDPTDTIAVSAGNTAPVIHGLDNIFVRVGDSTSLNFTVTDTPGDNITVSIPGKPSFITTLHPAVGNYTIRAIPTSDNSGTYNLTVIATDNHGKSSSSTIIITIGNKNTRSVMVNFGSDGKTAASPWNNWTGARGANDVSNSLKDETNTTTSITLTTLNSWSGTTDLGHITGNNSGVFPDDVLQSGLLDSATEAKQIRISGLNTSMQYNLAFAGSQNEGIAASSTYTAAGQSATLSARYNTNSTANLNNIVPDAHGEILVTIAHAGGTTVQYLNGMVIEEYAPSVQLLAPAHLYAEALDKTTVNLTWNDRTKNESITNGYELTRATDSLFTKNVAVMLLPANTTSFSNTGLTPNTIYWYQVRARGASGNSDYSNRFRVVTPATLVYVNFNTAVADGPAPWNNLDISPIDPFTTDPLKNESGVKTNITLTLTKTFNGEFTAGVITGNNSGMVPDNVLQSDYWLDKNQLSELVVNGLNHGKHYSFGFFGSSSAPVWFKGNYTATYTVNNRTVYLNSWENQTKVVYINDVLPDESGKVALDFSTTKEAGYGFNGGVIMQEYNDTTEAAGTVDTIPITTNPPIDSTGTNPPPVDSTGTNPPPVDSTGTNPPPVDSTGTNPPPVDSTGTGGTNPDSTISNLTGQLKVYPNPLYGNFHVSFNNSSASNKIALEIFDPRGALTFRREYGQMQKGTNLVPLTTYETNLKTGLYIVALLVDGKVVQSAKLIRIKN